MTEDVSSLLLQAVTIMQQQSRDSRPSENTSGFQQSSVISEHRRLFNRRRPAATERPTATTDNSACVKKRKSTRTWSHQFCALANKSQSNVPTRDECTRLSRGGLGIRQLTFNIDDNSSAVSETIISAFPPLKDGGGFELFILKSGSRSVLNSVSIGPMDVAQLRFLTSGRIYIRPLQQDVVLSETNNGINDGFKQACITCGDMMPIIDIPFHRRIMHSENTSDSETELPASGLQQWLHSADNARASNTANEETVNTTNPNTHADAAAESVSIPGVVVNAENNTETIDVSHSVAAETELKTLQQCIDDVAALDEHDPVALLRAFQRNVMYGRPLNLTSVESTIEGETVPLYVDRYNLITTAFDELRNILADGCDFRKPLDVTFYSEQAVDLGGPRLEFLTLCLKQMLNDDVGIFAKTDDGYTVTCRESLVEKNYYFLAGLVCGLSILQGGPMPCFMNPECIDKLLLNNGLDVMTRGEQQFLEGLNVVGLVEVMRRKPQMLFLLRATCEQPVSFRKLLLLLGPVFSDVGSNMRTRENEAYRVFVTYVREVSAGRRPPVTLGKILKFVTACETEPILGFSMQPTLEFQEDLLIPRANTCCCTLRIPLLTSAYNLELMDLAFTSDYFGYD